MRCVQAAEVLVVCFNPTPWWVFVVAIVPVAVLLACVVALVWAEVRDGRP